MSKCWSRRTFLQTSGAALAAALAGCLSGPLEPSQGNTSTQSPSESTSDHQLSLTTEMLSQSSTRTPPRFNVSLANTGYSPVDVVYGQSLMFSAGGTEQPDGLVVVPAGGGHNQPATPTEGCWKYTADYITIRTIRRETTLLPTQSLSADFTVYDDSDDDNCFSPGEYVFKDTSNAGAGQLGINLLVRITIDDAGSMSVEGAIHPSSRDG